MSLRRFLNVAYAILVEEYQRQGVDLISALEKVQELGAAPVGDAPRPTPRSVQASNDQSLKLLQGMMASTSNNPLQKKPQPRKR